MFKFKSKNGVSRIFKPLVLCFFVFSILFLSANPQSAQAQFATFDAGAISTAIGNAAEEAGRWIVNKAETVAKNALDVAQKVVIKGYVRNYLIQYAESTARQIATGNAGQKPTFDTKSMWAELEDAKNQQIADLAQAAIKDITSLDICEPINPELNLILLYTPISITKKKVPDRNYVGTCDTQKLAANLRKFNRLKEGIQSLNFNEPGVIARLGNLAADAGVNISTQVARTCQGGPRAGATCSVDRDCDQIVCQTLTNRKICIGGSKNNYWIDGDIAVNGVPGFIKEQDCDGRIEVFSSTEKVCQSSSEPRLPIGPKKTCNTDRDCFVARCVEKTVTVDSFDTIDNIANADFGIAAAVSSQFNNNQPGDSLTSLFRVMTKTSEAQIEAEQRKRDNNRNCIGGTCPTNTVNQETIKAPASSQVTQQGAVQNSLSREVLDTTYNLAVDVLNAFTSTLVANFGKQQFEESFNPAIPSSPFARFNAQFAQSTGDSTATNQFISLFGDAEININPGVQSVLNDLMTCPSEQLARNANNCVFSPSFRQAVDQKLTVKEAIDTGLLSRSLVFGYGDSGKTPNPNEGLSYRALLILQKYRIIPRSWVLASEYIKETVAYSERPVTLGDLIDQYNQPTSPYYRLVDPNWVLVAPEQFCALSGPSNIIQSSVVSRLPVQNDKAQQLTPNVVPVITDQANIVQNLVTRASYCADERTCVKEKDDGSCLYYGYCTKEKPIWRFKGKVCPVFYDSCRSLVKPDGTNVNYLTNSLAGQNVCNAATAGCMQYVYPENNDSLPSAQALIDVGLNQDGSNSVKTIYLSRSAKTCSAQADGCTQLIPTSQSNGNVVELLTAGTYDQSLEKVYVSKASLDCRNNDTTLGGPNYFVGCTSYTETKNPNNTVTAVARGQDICNAACVGFDTFDQQAINIGGGVAEAAKPFIDLIPSTATQCTAAEVGCEQFTNVSAGAGAAESVVAFKAVQSCSLPSDAGSNTQTYFTWQGSGTSGFGLKSWTLLKSNFTGFTDESGAAGPCTNFDQENKVCADTAEKLLATTNVGTDSYGGVALTPKPTIEAAEAQLGACSVYKQRGYFIFNSGSATSPAYSVGLGTPASTNLNLIKLVPPNSDCREFITAGGKSFYALASQVVSVSDQCQQFRRTTDQKIYNILTSASVSCQTQFAGCRAYRGNTGFNVTTGLANQNFKNLDSLNDWTSNNDTNRALISLNNATVEAQAANDKSLFINSNASALPPLIYRAQNAGQIIKAGTNNVLTFLARPAVAGNLEIRLYQIQAPNNPNPPNNAVTFIPKALAAGEIFTPIQVDGQDVILSTIELRPDWNQYTVSFRLPDNVVSQYSGTFLGFQSSAGSSLAIDNVSLIQNTDQYLIKDTWKQPTDSAGALLCATADLGCREYRSKGGNVLTVSRFSNLCRADFVGCQQFIDTKNTAEAAAQTLTTPYGALGADGKPGNYSITTEADALTYRVYNPEITNLICKPAEMGCQKFGRVNYAVDSDNPGVASKPSRVDEVYLLNQPDTYTTFNPILCGPGAIMCEAFKDQQNQGNDVYAYDPGDKTCTYDSLKKNWFVTGTTKACPIDLFDANGNRCERNLEGPGYFRAGTVGIACVPVAPTVIQKPRETYAQTCESRYDSCTLYIDPSISTDQKSDECLIPDDKRLYQPEFQNAINLSEAESKQLSDKLCQAYAYKSNSVDTKSCSGENVETGCVAFGRKDSDVTQDLDEVVNTNSSQNVPLSYTGPYSKVKTFKQSKDSTNPRVTVLKVQKDRICAESLVSKGGVYVMTKTGDRVFTRTTFRACSDQNGADSCASSKEYTKEGQIFEQSDFDNNAQEFEDFRNQSGYSLAGLTIITNNNNASTTTSTTLKLGENLPIGAMTISGDTKFNFDGDFESIQLKTNPANDKGNILSQSLMNTELYKFGLETVDSNTNISVTNAVNDSPFVNIFSGNQVLKVQNTITNVNTSSPKPVRLLRLGQASTASETGGQGVKFSVSTGDKIVATAKVISEYDSGTLTLDLDCVTNSITNKVKRGSDSGNNGSTEKIYANKINSARGQWQDLYFEMVAKGEGSCTVVLTAIPRESGTVNAYIDNLFVGSALSNAPEITDNTSSPQTPEIDRPLIGPTCRLFPTYNAVSCDYTDTRSRQKYSGYYGYCLVPDPEDPRQCITWHPADCTTGNKCLFDINGSAKKYERAYKGQDGLLYCLVGTDEKVQLPTSGFFKNVNGSSLNDYKTTDNNGTNHDCSQNTENINTDIEVYFRQGLSTNNISIPLFRLRDNDSIEFKIKTQFQADGNDDDNGGQGDFVNPTFNFSRTVGQLRSTNQHYYFEFFTIPDRCTNTESSFESTHTFVPIIKGDYLLGFRIESRGKTGEDSFKQKDGYENNNSLYSIDYSQWQYSDFKVIRNETNSPTDTDTIGLPICKVLVQAVDEGRNYVGWETRLNAAKPGTVLNVTEAEDGLYETNGVKKITDKNSVPTGNSYILYQSGFQDDNKGTESLLPYFGSVSGSWDSSLNRLDGVYNGGPLIIQSTGTSDPNKLRASYAYSYESAMPYTPFNESNIPVCIARNPSNGVTDIFSGTVVNNDNANKCIDPLGTNGIIGWYTPGQTPIASDKNTAISHLGALFPTVSKAWVWNGTDYVPDNSSNGSYIYDCRNGANDNYCLVSATLPVGVSKEQYHKVKISNLIMNYNSVAADEDKPDLTFKKNVPVKLSFDIKANLDQLPIRKIIINWGDGDIETLNALQDSDNQRVTAVHTYQTTGDFIVLVDAVDNWCWGTTGFEGVPKKTKCELPVPEQDPNQATNLTYPGKKVIKVVNYLSL